MSIPVNHEIAAALGRFFTGGSGPTHASLSSIFNQHGYHDADPYDPVERTPNKETRVRTVLSAAVKRKQRARELVEALLAEMRALRCFDATSMDYEPHTVKSAQSAFRRAGWGLSEDGELRRMSTVSVEASEGRPAIDEQLTRLHRAAEDPVLMLGTAKEMLESTAKYVLEEFGIEYSSSVDFDKLWFEARDRLGIHPQDVDVYPHPAVGSSRRSIKVPGTSPARRMSSEGSKARDTERTLPTGVSPEAALFVVREVSSVVEFTLTTLDRQFGR